MHARACFRDVIQNANSRAIFEFPIDGTTAASEKLVRIIIHMVLNDDCYDWIRGLNLLIIIQMMHAFILRYPHSS